MFSIMPYRLSVAFEYPAVNRLGNYVLSVGGGSDIVFSNVKLRRIPNVAVNRQSGPDDPYRLSDHRF